ncbi:hypothetical protein AMD00_22550 [Viridibacillus arvi]|uniref:Uncharacterized protein n=1 Tax=Viridibacillus arvi TaxID=263475 RepID=A0A0M0L6R2_9BACL|nr:hypothetical protein AMD00_22550 [Viridibacillus arvi]
MKRYISVLIALIINGLCILFTVNFDKNLTPYIWFTLFYCMVAFYWSMYEVYKNRGITHIPILLNLKYQPLLLPTISHYTLANIKAWMPMMTWKKKHYLFFKNVRQ